MVSMGSVMRAALPDLSEGCIKKILVQRETAMSVEGLA